VAGWFVFQRPYSHGMCGCFSSCSTCIYATCCPCCAAAQATAMVQVRMSLRSCVCTNTCTNDKNQAYKQSLFMRFLLSKNDDNFFVYCRQVLQNMMHNPHGFPTEHMVVVACFSKTLWTYWRERLQTSSVTSPLVNGFKTSIVVSIVYNMMTRELAGLAT